MSLFAGSTTPLLSMRHEEVESICQPVLLPPLKQTTQNPHKKHSLPPEIQQPSLLLISVGL